MAFLVAMLREDGQRSILTIFDASRGHLQSHSRRAMLSTPKLLRAGGTYPDTPARSSA
jgi:hypothetical protein